MENDDQVKACRKNHRPGNLNTSHSSRGWKFKIKVPVGLVSTEVSLLGLQSALLPAVSLCLNLLLFLGHQSDWIRAHSYCFLFT